MSKEHGQSKSTQSVEVIDYIDPLIVHRGPLKVTLEGLKLGRHNKFTTNLIEPGTLLVNIGHVAAVLCTDFDHPVVKMNPEDWILTKYDPVKRVLRAAYVGETNLIPDAADLDDFYDYS